MKKASSPSFELFIGNPDNHPIPDGIDEMKFRSLADASATIPHVYLICRVGINDSSFSMDSRTDRYSVRFVVDLRTSTFFLQEIRVRRKFQRQGIAFRMLVHLLRWAREAGVKTIQLYALGGWLIPEDQRWDSLAINGVRLKPALNGYYTWGRLGFRMFPEDELLFKSWNRYFNCKQQTFPSVMLDTSDSVIWLTDGFGWRGFFLTAENSEMQLHLDVYQETKRATGRFLQ